MMKFGRKLQNKYFSGFSTCEKMSNDEMENKIYQMGNTIQAVQLMAGFCIGLYILSYPLSYIKKQYDEYIIVKYIRLCEKHDLEHKRIIEQERIKRFLDREERKND